MTIDEIIKEQNTNIVYRKLIDYTIIEYKTGKQLRREKRFKERKHETKKQ